MSDVVMRGEQMDVAGRWRVYVRPPRGAPVEVTTVRGVPTQLTALSWEDPYGPKDLSMSFPQISLLDDWGHGDLHWLVPDSDVDVVWDGPLPDQWPTGHWLPDPDAPAFVPGPLVPPSPGPGHRWRPAWRWEGFFPSLESAKGGDGGTTLQAVGALRQLDCYLAKPEYASRPLPYEYAIARQLASRPHLRVSRLQVLWPSWWDTVFAHEAGLPWYMVPAGVQHGQRWSGYLTRNTGQWNPVLTGYIQQLLLSMYTARGRFTLDLMPGRVASLAHRELFSADQAGFVRVDSVDPGVELSLRVDNSQSVGVVYGQGRSRSGTAYSGKTVSGDGQTTSYAPLAASAQVHPESDTRGWLDRSRIRRETMLQLTEGLDAAEAIEVGRQHHRRFADAGVTGTVTLRSSVTMDGQPLHHMLLRAGMSLVLPGVLGQRELVLHVTETSLDFERGSITLTVDSKYRDALTVDEVRMRTRDALAVPRMMIAGQYSPPIPDQLVPWNYGEGSGVIPSGPNFNAHPLFRDMPVHLPFPWTEWTRQRPPKDPRWRYAYIRIGPASTNANDNWGSVTDKDGARLGFPVRLAQAGAVRLLQMAAYDADGNVLPVEFHLSLHTSRGVNYQGMPVISETDIASGTVPAQYTHGQHYPFFLNAWEKYNLDGTLTNPQTPHATEGTGLIKAWGTHFERPGHFPGSQEDPPTGLLVDEAGFEFDLTAPSSSFDPYSPDKNQVNPDAGMVYAMVYCDAQGPQPVYFLGRMFRAEPGAEA